MKKQFILASRRSPLALAQTHLAGQYITERVPGSSYEILELVTTGDRRLNWSLEKKGGKGLFTKELEEALLAKKADFAIHSAKDLPTELPEELGIVGYLPREVVHDVVVLREGVKEPKVIATSSPRRRAQSSLLYPEAKFIDIRGNIQTRLRKIAEGYADATILAGAGLRRMGITQHEDVCFRSFNLQEMVPAAGQGAIALECRKELISEMEALFDESTKYAVSLERKFLADLGGGCHSAHAVHYFEGKMYLFEEAEGYREVSIGDE